jgi:tetratricopeptide (TPR) repeat protein
VAAVEAAAARAGFEVVDLSLAAGGDRALRGADVYVGVVGLGDDRELSLAELAFDLVTELRMPRLVFLVSESGAHTTPARLAAFRRRLRETSGLTLAPVTTPQTLEIALFQSLVELGRAVSPRQLPADVDAFVGRAHELAELDALLAAAERTPSIVVVSAVSGGAGVGKTALVVHWAHRVADRFPDGHLYLDLRGYDPAEPVEPADALAVLLRCLGIHGLHIPYEVEERGARYRALMDGRRILLVLDNAQRAEHVRLLLPETPSCFVVVTSRDSLDELAGRHGARRIDLDRLRLEEAVDLLRALVGPRAEAEAAGTEALAEQCARLPLALRIAAELVAARGAASIDDLVAELSDEQRRLRLLDAAGDPRTDVRAVFSWSHRHLPADAARLFRLLGLVSGADVSPAAAAALAGIDRARADELLAVLVRAHLVEPYAPGRFRLHDLLRLYAADRATADETGRDRHEAVRRLLAWYLHSADAADLVLLPQRPRDAHPPVPPGVRPLTFDSPGDALAWCDVERANLVAATRQAAAWGEHDIAWRLPVVLFNFFNMRKHSIDWIATAGAGLAAARSIGDRHGETWCLAMLGRAHGDLKRLDEALDWYGQALLTARAASELWGEAMILTGMGICCVDLGRLPAAAEHDRLAVAIFRQLGDRWGECLALHNLGTVHQGLGQLETAVEVTSRALDIACAIHDRWSEAWCLKNLGDAHLAAGRVGHAGACLRRALAASREVGDRQCEAAGLNNLGVALHATGDAEEAWECWRQALVIFDDLGHPQAAQLRAHVRGRDGGSGLPDPHPRLA